MFDGLKDLLKYETFQFEQCVRSSDDSVPRSGQTILKENKCVNGGPFPSQHRLSYSYCPTSACDQWFSSKSCRQSEHNWHRFYAASIYSIAAVSKYQSGLDSTPQGFERYQSTFCGDFLSYAWGIFQPVSSCEWQPDESCMGYQSTIIFRICYDSIVSDRFQESNCCR